MKSSFLFHKNATNSKQKQAVITCTPDDARFRHIVGYISCLVDIIATHLSRDKGLETIDNLTEISDLIFNILPSDGGSIDNQDYHKDFQGEFADDLIEIITGYLEIWKVIQDIRVFGHTVESIYERGEWARIIPLTEKLVGKVDMLQKKVC